MQMKRSYAITNTKYILTLLIVYLHCTKHVEALGSASAWYSLMDCIMKMLEDSATPAFFLISAYLLFRNFRFDDYGRKLETRFKSLLVPFVLFQAIAFLVPFLGKIVLLRNIETTPLLEFIIGVLHQSYNPPLWFLVTLFLFAASAPAIWLLLLKWGGKGTIAGITFFYIVNLIDQVPYISLFFWMPIIIFGAYMGYLENQGKKNIWDVSWKWGLLIIPLIVLAYFLWGGDYKGSVYYSYRMLSGIAAVVLWGG